MDNKIFTIYNLLGSFLKKENINVCFSDNDWNLKKETDLPLFKHGAYKLSIYSWSLNIHLPSTEVTEAVANKLQTESAETFQKTQISEIELISKG